jgi:hypothetical protein
MLHYLDDLDSKMESMRAQLEREANNGGDWAGYNNSLGRPLLDSRKIMERLKAAAQPVSAATPEVSEPASQIELAVSAGSE